MSSSQRYINCEFTCQNCRNVNETRVDTLNDVQYKGKNPPIQDSHRRLPYYTRNCKYCGAYNEIPWTEN